jgi:hypothetical protein
MKRRFCIQRVGRFRRSAARGMAEAGFDATVIAMVLRLRMSTARDIVAGRNAPSAIWSAAEQKLFREGRR